MARAHELTDEQWLLVADLFDPPGRRGPKAKVPRRQMVEAVLWLARTGCQWRELPERYGRWEAVWGQFYRWRRKGVWVQAMDRLRRAARTAAGRVAEPSMVMVDCQAIQGRRAGPGFHAKGGKFGRTKGTKRAVAVDVLGLPVAALADAASNDDTVLVGRLLDEHAPRLPRLELVLGDRGFRNLAHRAARDHSVMFEVRYWEERPEGGFKPIQPMWRIEDAFARLGAWRRLSRCFEGSAAGATAWLQVACVGVLLARLR